MKKFVSALVLVSVAVFALCLFGIAASYAEDIPEGAAFNDDGTPEVYATIVNNTGWTFRGIWMRPSSNTRWQARDRFTSNGRVITLRNGQSITLAPNSASRHGVRFWDIRIDYGQGKTKVISNIDVYNVYEIDIGRNFRVEFQR